VHDDDTREQHPLRPLSPRRLLVTIGGALALILLVVVASHGDRPTGGSAGDAQTASKVLVDVLLLVFAIVAAGMLVTTLLSFQPVKGADPKPRTGPRLFGQIMAFVLIIGVVVLALQFFRGNGRGQDEEAPGSGAARNALKKADKTKDGSTQNVDWLPVVIVFGAAVLAFTVAGVVVLRRGPLPPRDDLAERLAVVFDETLNDLKAERDPRRAVIAAYARMERILGRHGLPRRPAEAPHEYVSRVLEDLISSGSSVRRLTRLYERAKFSPHEMDEAMKEEAIDAVAAVRDELHAREAEALIAAPH
jgi:Domain of unknown function (DUF4129)